MLAALVLVIAGTGFAAAAGKALPGDILYPVKINFNEKIRDITTLGPYAQLAWKEKKVDRRLNELNSLIDENRLDQNTADQVRVGLTASTAEFQLAIKKLAKQNKINKAMAVSNKAITKIRSHAIAAKIAKLQEDTDEEKASLAENIKNDIDNAIDEHEDATASFEAESIENEIARLEAEGVESWGKIRNIQKTKMDAENPFAKAPNPKKRPADGKTLADRHGKLDELDNLEKDIEKYENEELQSAVQARPFALNYNQANYDLIISFYSKGEGIDQKSKDKFDEFLANFENKNNLQNYKYAVSWGREGEIDYCLNLTRLSAENKEKFIKEAKNLRQDSDLVHLSENAPCSRAR